MTAALRPPGRSPFRVLLTFVVALGVVLLVAGAVAVALTPPPPVPDCPDPNQICGRPPEQPTLPPATQVAGASPAPSPPGRPLPTEAPSVGATTAPTVASTAAPTLASTEAPTAAPSVLPPTPVPSPQPTGAATAEPTLEPTLEPTPPPTPEPSAPSPAAPSESPSEAPVGPSPTPGIGFVVPAPRPASDAAPYRAGTVWRSSEWGFSFEYDDDLWTVNDEGPRGVQLLAARGNVSLSIGAFPAADRSPQELFEDEQDRLADNILGFTEEPDPLLALPGLPNVGYRIGHGGAFAGTVNSPQGPTVNVSIAILTAGDERMTVLVSLVTTTRLRPAAFSVADSVLNTFRWTDPEG